MDRRIQGKTCPFCKTPFRVSDIIVICDTCEMPHHLSCWQENNGCATYGCTGSIQEMIAADSDGLPEQETLDAFFGSAELADEYVRETTEQARYTPVQGPKYWRCACSVLNSNRSENCCRCQSNKEQLFSLLNAELLSKNLEVYKKEEKRAQTERRQSAQEQTRREWVAEEVKKRRKERKQKRRELLPILKKWGSRIKWPGLIAASIFLLGFLVYSTFWNMIPSVRYKNACKSLEAGEYDAAYEIFISLGNYRDSAEKAVDTMYQKGIFCVNGGSYADAMEAFDLVSGYRDSDLLAIYCGLGANYQKGTEYLLSGQYEQAYLIFKQLSDSYNFRDSARSAAGIGYELGIRCYQKQKYEEAYSYFQCDPLYRNSQSRANECLYQYAGQCLAKKAYSEAIEAYQKLIGSGYKDTASRLEEAKYRYAVVLRNKYDYVGATVLFQELGTYKDSEIRNQEASYKLGINLLSNTLYKEAAAAFASAGNYLRSVEKMNEAKYLYVLAHKYWPDDDTARSFLDDLMAVDYRDSREIYARIDGRFYI